MYMSSKYKYLDIENLIMLMDTVNSHNYRIAMFTSSNTGNSDRNTKSCSTLFKSIVFQPPVCTHRVPRILADVACFAVYTLPRRSSGAFRKLL